MRLELPLPRRTPGALKMMIAPVQDSVSIYLLVAPMAFAEEEWAEPLRALAELAGA